MTAIELEFAKDVVKVIATNFEVDKTANWMEFVESLATFYKGGIPADIWFAIDYFAIDENRKNWKEFLVYLDYSIYNKKMKQENEEE